MKRHQPLRPKKPIKKRNPKRQAREKARAYGSADRRQFILNHPCLVCFRGPSQQAHVKGDGGSRKGDADKVIPLCHFHHIETLHRIGVPDFERLYAVELSGLTLLDWAAKFDAAWLAFSGEDAA